MGIPLADHLGIRFGDAADGHSSCLLPLKPEHGNSSGAAHGGIAFTLADTGMGAALKTLLVPSERCVTIELKINYHRPSKGAVMSCDSTVIHKGRTVASVESRVSVDGALVATACGTFAIRPITN
jgi:acyl-CoA thioesterase